jgi:thiamine-phosphate pyrophosphorylase
LRLPARLLIITDRKGAARPLEDVVGAALCGGCRWLSLREKDLEHVERVALLARSVALGRSRGATITVHGDIEAAAAAGADGVHLPAGGSPDQARARLGEQALIGLSVHSAVEAANAVSADYVTLSPIFGSISKPGYGPALGLQSLADAALRARVPIVALGGIAAHNLGPCLAAGATAVAVMGAVMAAADPEATTAALVQALDEAGERAAC